MKNGLYSVSVKGFDGVDWPPGGVVVLLDGVMLGGGAYTYYTGSYSFKDGIFKAELVLNQHNFPPPRSRVFQRKECGHRCLGHLRGRSGRTDWHRAGRDKKPHSSCDLTETGGA